MANRMLVNIRGCNGSGKSTIPLSMMDDPKVCIETLMDNTGKKVTAFTVFPSYKWIALGTYLNKTGGLDTISSIEAIKIALHAAICMYPEYDVLMEGIICSTTFSSYASLFHEVEKAYGMRVLVISIMPPVEEAIKRVYARNGGKQIKEDLIRGKWNSVYNSHKKFKADKFFTARVNSSKIPKSKMLPCFFKTVEKYRQEK